jgi:phytoene/squalene synthetase
MVTIERFDEASTLVRRSDAGSATSPDEETAITTRIRNASASYFWLTRLLPGPRRKAMQALYSFCRELREITDGEASPTLKLTLLGDWRAEIASLYAGRPQHLVTRALRDAIESFDLCCRDFLAVIDGMAMNSRFDIRAPSLEQLDFHNEKRAVATVRIALRILGAPPPDSERVAATLGRGMQFTGILRDLARDAAQQRLYLPRELLLAEGIFATMPSYVLAQPALPQVCNALAERAEAYFVDAERTIPVGPNWATLATTAVLGSYRALLKALLARGWAPIDEPVGIPAWRQTALLLGYGLIGR